MTETPPAPKARTTETVSGPATAYRVLARKYRPRTFAELIGQEALVRTLTNAVASGRIAQAFMLTGVRGVGKTTTARIIARALNCIGPDGQGGPTITPCGQCDPCLAILQDRHVDVLEMDAASHTGVDDMREIIQGVRYAPVSARYKLYIIDEVHMLSKNAFNALLKTLEEPPSHVKFVFATTEIRKVPVTVLSRCQRFDLRRVPVPVLIEHFNRIAAQEQVTVEPDAMTLIARAADGSVRDGLSLLDQAIALGCGAVTGEQVRDMLGLADRSLVLDLFEATVSARPRDALEILASLHRVGADPLVVLRDLLDFTHFLTRTRVAPETTDDPTTPEAERMRGGELAKRLSMPALTRAWQILLKGLNEAQMAPEPHQAVEMVIIRLAHTADLPSPADLVRQLQTGQPPAASRPPSGPVASTPISPRGSDFASSPGPSPGPVGGRMTHTTAVAAHRNVTAVAQLPPVAANTSPISIPSSFRDLVQLFADRREGTLYAHLHGSVHLVRCEPGILEIRVAASTPANLANRVGTLLETWTGRRWLVALSSAPGDKTLAEQDRQAYEQTLDTAARHPVAQAVLEAFPGAKIVEVRAPTMLAAPSVTDGESGLVDETTNDELIDGFDEEGVLDP
ncbi:DNA polymerase III subunit gamma/tau [uncultured Gammaproteobacteria bacterium]